MEIFNEILWYNHNLADIPPFYARLLFLYAKLRSVVISGNVVESIRFSCVVSACDSYDGLRSVRMAGYRLSSHSGLYNRSSLSSRFTATDEALRNVSAIFAFKSDSWNSIFGSKANFMEHLSLLGYVLIAPTAFYRLDRS